MTDLNRKNLKNSVGFIIATLVLGSAAYLYWYTPEPNTMSGGTTLIVEYDDGTVEEFEPPALSILEPLTTARTRSGNKINWITAKFRGEATFEDTETRFNVSILIEGYWTIDGTRVQDFSEKDSDYDKRMKSGGEITLEETTISSSVLRSVGIGEHTLAVVVTKTQITLLDGTVIVGNNPTRDLVYVVS